MALTSTRLLVGAIPWNSPLWVPRMVTLAVTLSPSANHTLDADGEVRETLTGLRQSLLEGVDELGRSPGRSSLSGTEASTISSAGSKSPAEMIS